jgi:hypothetical protein
MRTRILGLLSALCAFASASAVQFEIESNGTIPSAQTISRTSGIWADVLFASLTPTDIDFFKVYLEAGDILTVITTPLSGPSFRDPDTFLRIATATGTPIFENDDSGSGFGSAGQYQAVESGFYVIGITGVDDPTFNGFHTEDGDYLMTVSVVPEPASMFALAAGVGILMRRRRVG